MISQQDLGPEVVSLGVLLGLLTESGDNVTVNQDWFKNPLAPNSPSLDNAGQRLLGLGADAGRHAAASPRGTPECHPEADVRPHRARHSSHAVEVAR